MSAHRCQEPGCMAFTPTDYCRPHQASRAHIANLERTLDAQMAMAARCHTETGRAVALRYAMTTAAHLRATREELERAAGEAVSR